jgi:hypothetical protein
MTILSTEVPTNLLYYTNVALSTTYTLMKSSPWVGIFMRKDKTRFLAGFHSLYVVIDFAFSIRVQ